MSNEPKDQQDKREERRDEPVEDLTPEDEESAEVKGGHPPSPAQPTT
jgi:hypothetical protein